MSGMFNLGDVFQLVIDCLDYGSLSKQYSVIHGSESTFHIVFQFGNQLYPINEQLAEQVFADIALVSDEFAINEFYERLYFQWFTVIDIARRYHEVQNLTLVIANQMQLKAVEPSQRAFATLCQPLENLVHVDALIPAHPQQGTVHEADSGTFAKQTLLYEDDELYNY